MIYFIVKLKRILIVVHQVQGVKSPSDVLIFQTAHCIADMAQIALGGLVGEQDLIVPVETDKIVLAFAEQIQELPLKCSIFCIFRTGQLSFLRFRHTAESSFAAPSGTLFSGFHIPQIAFIVPGDLINLFHSFIYRIRDLLRLCRPLQQDPDALFISPASNRSDALLERLKRPSDIHRSYFYPVKRHDEKSVELMVKLKYIRIIILVIIKLGVVMCLHELRTAEFIHHRRDS